MKRLLIMILIFTITFTAVLQVPQKRVDAFAPIVLLGLTIPEVAVLACLATLVVVGFKFATDSAARDNAKAFFSNTSQHMSSGDWGAMVDDFSNIGTTGHIDPATGLEFTGQAGMVWIDGGFWANVQDYKNSKLNASTTSITPDYIFGEDGIPVGNDGGHYSNTNFTTLGLAQTLTLTNGEEISTLKYDITRPSYSQIFKPTLLTVNGLTNNFHNDIPAYSSVGVTTWTSYETIPLDSEAVYFKMDNDYIEIYQYASNPGTLIQPIPVPSWHLVTRWHRNTPVTNYGANPITIPTTAYAPALTNDYARIKDTTGARAIPADLTAIGVDSIVNADAQTLTDAQAVAMSVALPIPLPYFPDAWSRFRGLTLPEMITTKFPFSIPWDLVNAVKLLNASPEVPVFIIPFELERFGIYESITIDLSQFEYLAKIARFFFLLIFMFAMVFVTKKLVGGEG